MPDRFSLGSGQLLECVTKAIIQFLTSSDNSHPSSNVINLIFCNNLPEIPVSELIPSLQLTSIFL